MKLRPEVKKAFLIGTICAIANAIMSVCYLAVAYKPLQTK